MEVLRILKNVRARYGGSVVMGRTGLHNGNSEPYRPSIEAWKKLMSKKDFNTALAAVNEEGYWINDLDRMIPVFEAALKTIFPLLGKMGNITLAPIITSLRTYGIYSPSSSSMKSLRSHLDKAGFPSWFMPAQGAAVLLCIEEIEERLKEVNAVKSETKESAEVKAAFDEAALREKLIFETLLHEHTHAIIDEGKDRDASGGSRCDIHTGKKAGLINESLAEWVALNYFRNDDEMYEIIRQHAIHGDLPEWPYAGAMPVEQKFEIAGLAGFRSLLQLFRSNSEEAYRYLKTA